MSSEPFRVLSIDGGGIRGIIPAKVLSYIERRTRLPTAQCFDLIAGTSTGGLLTLGLTLGERRRPRRSSSRAGANAGGGGGGAANPKYRAEDMLDLYFEQGPKIFHDSIWRRVPGMKYLGDERYNSGPIEDVLREYFGDSRLADALTPIIVPAYDIERRKPLFFKSERAALSSARDAFVRDVARATSAAPTFFEPHLIENAGDSSVDESRKVLIDGGVFANNPAMCAYSEAARMLAERGETDRPITILSLGTGKVTRSYDYERAKGWGQLEWIRPVLSIMMDGMSDSVEYHLKNLLNDGGGGNPRRYLRVEIELADANDDMDDASKTNMRALARLGDAAIDENQSDLDTFLEDAQIM